MTNILAANANIDEGLGRNVGGSFEREINTNVGLINQADQINQRTGMLETNANYDDRKYTQEQKMSAVTNANNVYGSYIKDSNMYAKDKELNNFAGTTNFGTFTDPNGQKRPIFMRDNGKKYYTDDNGTQHEIG
jgi:hypothetical protein